MIDYLFIFTSILGLIFPTNSYLIWIKMKFGFYPTSYSSTYGMLWDLSEESEPKKHITHIFTSWANEHAVYLLPALTWYSDNLIQILMAGIALTALMFVGRCPTSVNKEVTKIHCFMAKLCALDAIIWLFLKGIYAPTLVLCIGGYIWSKGWQKKYECTIMEYMAFTSAYVGVIVCALRSLGIL